MKIALLIPTELEATPFVEGLPNCVSLHISGVGMAQTAATTAAIIATSAPDFIILAGIAGAYPDSGVAIGDCVAVVSELVADLGAFRNGLFTPLFQREYRSTYALEQSVMRTVNSYTVNAAGGDFYDAVGRGGAMPAEIENMEGASFFAVCHAMQVDFMEIRAISNLTNSPRSGWEIGRAVEALSVGVRGIIANFVTKKESALSDLFAI